MPHFRTHYTAYRQATQSWSDLNIPIPPGATGEARTICPQCAPNRRNPDNSLSVNVREGLWYCHYCHWKGSLTRPGSTPSLPPARPRPAPRQRSPDDTERRQRALERVWRQAHAVTPTDPAARYLQRRGLWQEPVPEVLRCHPRLPYLHEDEHFSYHPALVASVQGPGVAKAEILAKCFYKRNSNGL